MRANAHHRLINLLHSALLLGGMGLTAWLVLAAVFDQWIALFAMIGLVGGLALAPRASKDVLLRLYRAQRIDARAMPECVRMVEALGRRAGLPAAPALYYIPSAAPNAFAIGSRADSAIGVSDGLLRLMNRREIAGVLAHEVSHIANNDLWIMGLADAMTRVTSLLSSLGQILLLISIPFLLVGDPIAPWWAPLLMIVSPIAMSLLQLALSRTREFDADRGGAELAGDAVGLASALAKLERRRGAFWEEIVFPGRRMPEPSLLRTHPPTPERIARLKQYAAEHPEARPIETPGAITIAAPIRIVDAPPRLRWNGLWY